MAIYYIDPHISTTTGDGSYANPWSFASSTRTGLTDGDEIRIKGVALTSLLTATSYTVTYDTFGAITVTAGGGLGADFALGSVVYFPAVDAFAKVTAVSSNTLSFTNTTAMVLPFLSTATGQSFTMRKVDTTTYPASSTTTNLYITPATGAPINNFTVSDCWTSSTTRVTDGSVKTLVHTSFSGNAALTLSAQSAGSIASNVTFNLNNTHFLPGNSASASTLTATSYYSNITATINQIYGQSASGGFVVGTNTIPVVNATYNVTNFTAGNLFSGSTNSNYNCTFNITNAFLRYADQFLTSATADTMNIKNITVAIQKIIGYQLQGTAIIAVYFNNNYTFSINDYQDVYSNNTCNYIFYGSGLVTYSFGSSFTQYKNRRASTNTSVSQAGVFWNSGLTGLQGKMECPPLVVPTGWTTPSTPYTASLGASNTAGGQYQQSQLYKKPTLIEAIAPVRPSNYDSTYPGVTNNTNFLVTFKNGDAPLEVLGTNSVTYNAATATYCPVVTTDSSTYQSTSPSLKAYLGTFNLAFFAPGSKPIKNIKIPVTSGVSYTVTGYVRSNDSAFTNGDSVVSVLMNDVELDTQSMTTSCINAWEQFTLTFTAPATGEAYLAWEVYIVTGTKSIWLSDLTIV